MTFQVCFCFNGITFFLFFSFAPWQNVNIANCSMIWVAMVEQEGKLKLMLFF